MDIIKELQARLLVNRAISSQTIREDDGAEYNSRVEDTAGVIARNLPTSTLTTHIDRHIKDHYGISPIHPDHKKHFNTLFKASLQHLANSIVDD